MLQGLKTNNATTERKFMLSTIALGLIILWLLALVTWSLPKSIADAVKQRRRQTVLDESEAERLDRIRNPSKYLGK